MGCLSTNKLASGLTLRCVLIYPLHSCPHEYETPTQAAQRIAGEVLGVHTSRVGVTWRGQDISRLLIDGKDPGDSVIASISDVLPLARIERRDSTDRARRLILVDRISRLNAAKIADVERALDEIDVPAPTTDDDEAHGRTLAYTVGIRAMWDQITPATKALYVERARRLRKRWGCGDGPMSENERAQMSKTLLEVCADRDNLYRRKEDLWRELSELRARIDEYRVEEERLAREKGKMMAERDCALGAVERATSIGESYRADLNTAEERMEAMSVRNSVVTDAMASDILRLRSELASAMATLESVALADDHLREVAGRVVGEFERTGTKNVGSLVQDLREVLK